MHKLKRYTNTFSGHKNMFRKLSSDCGAGLQDLVDEFDKMDSFRLPDGKLPQWYVDIEDSNSTLPRGATLRK